MSFTKLTVVVTASTLTGAYVLARRGQLGSSVVDLTNDKVRHYYNIKKENSLLFDKVNYTVDHTDMRILSHDVAQYSVRPMKVVKSGNEVSE